MSRDARIDFPWADGDHTFRLAWGELEMLQEACDAGPYVVLSRLYGEDWKLGDIYHTLRLGLIGGGMKPAEALKLTATYIKRRPPVENIMFAQAVLSAGCHGAPEERLGEPDAPSQAESSLTVSQTGN